MKNEREFQHQHDVMAMTELSISGYPISLKHSERTWVWEELTRYNHPTTKTNGKKGEKNIQRIVFTQLKAYCTSLT